MSTDKFYVMYHATDSWHRVESILRKGFHRSNKRDNMLGHGVYMSRQEWKTRNYGYFCFKLVVYTGRTRVITDQDDPMIKEWHRNYDSAWVPPNCGVVPSGLEENCIENPRHIVIVGMVRGYQMLPLHVKQLTHDCSGNIPGVGRRENAAGLELWQKLAFLQGKYYNIQPGIAMDIHDVQDDPDFDCEYGSDIHDVYDDSDSDSEYGCSYTSYCYSYSY